MNPAHTRSAHRFPFPRRPLLATLLACLLVPALALAAEREVNRSFDLGDAGRISLENINGDVHIEATSGSQVNVRVRITSRSQQAVTDLEIEFRHSGDSLSIETEYPDSRGGWIGGRNQSATAEYWLQVPAGTNLSDISLVNGSLDIRGVAGDVEATLVNGSLEASGLAGDVELSTVNGSIEARFDALGGGQRIDIESVNGSVDLWIPDAADASFDAETVHGKIRNDFGMDVDKERWVGSEMRGRLGSGSARVSLENVNGSIEIHRN